MKVLCMSTNNNSQITLDQFVTELCNDLVSFQSHWKAQHRNNPGEFPMTFDNDDTGQWMEQFLAFIDFEY